MDRVTLERLWRSVFVTVLGWTLALTARQTQAATHDDARVEYAPVPAWVLAVPELAATEPEATGGVGTLLFDNQTRVVGREVWRFYRRVVHLTSEAGLHAWGELKLDFVPPAQRLLIHGIRVRRGAVVVSKLELDKIEVLHRARELEQQGVYDGTRTALAVLSDLRVGDVLELEYSVVGQNPVFAGHFTDIWTTRQAVAIGFARHRLLADRPFAVARLGTALQPTDTVQGGLHDYRLEVLAQPPTVFEEQTPVEITPVRLGLLELSDSGSWADVATWGNGLFALPSPLPASIVEFAKRWRDSGMSTKRRSSGRFASNAT
jgi:hypothetical protein